MGPLQTFTAPYQASMAVRLQACLCLWDVPDLRTNSGALCAVGSSMGLKHDICSQKWTAAYKHMVLFDENFLALVLLSILSLPIKDLGSQARKDIRHCPAGK